MLFETTSGVKRINLISSLKETEKGNKYIRPLLESQSFVDSKNLESSVELCVTYPGGVVS